MEYLLQIDNIEAGVDYVKVGYNAYKDYNSLNLDNLSRVIIGNGIRGSLSGGKFALLNGTRYLFDKALYASLGASFYGFLGIAEYGLAEWHYNDLDISSDSINFALSIQRDLIIAKSTAAAIGAIIGGVAFGPLGAVIGGFIAGTVVEMIYNIEMERRYGNN